MTLVINCVVDDLRYFIEPRDFQRLWIFVPTKNMVKILENIRKSESGKYSRETS